MKNLTKATIAIIAGLGFAGFASAESTTGNAEVLLLDTISFVEDQIVDFDTITAGTGTCTMDDAGALVGPGICDGGTGVRGQITVSGTAGQNVQVTVGSGSTDNGVTFTPWLDNAETNSLPLALDGTGNLVVNIQGKLDLVAAAGGARAMTYTFTVDYN